MAIEKHLLGRIIHKHDIEENWDKATGFIPQQGEIIVYDIDDNYEYERFKIGNGVTTVTNLPFQKTNINDLKAVSYDIAQELTDEQKIQARANIGAGEPQVQSDLSQTDEAASDYVKGVIRQESLPEGYPYEEVREVVILPETEFSTVYAGRDSRDSITVDSNFKFEDGIEYIITFNGAKYICKRNVYNEITFLGNAHISYNILPGNPFDSMDTNEPFMIFIKDSEPTTLYINTIIPIDCSVSIVYDDSITHAIDYKYMPEGYPYEEIKVFDITNWEYRLSSFYDSLDISHNKNIPFALGQVWSVYGNSLLSNNTDVYECVVQQTDDGILYIGDSELTSIPFCVTANEAAISEAFQTQFTDANTSDKVTALCLKCVSGEYCEKGEIHTINPKYIKDMYHEESSEVFSIENAEFTDGQYTCETPFVITDGNTYIVNWDGTEYTCVAYTFEGFPAISNTLLFGGTGNGEPFIIGYDSEANVNFITALNDFTDGLTATHTVSVVENVVHTIDHKYIKDMYYDNGSTTTVLVDNQTVTGFEVREDPIYAVKNPFSFAPTVGATYTVTWDGTVYECTASVANGLIYIGNVNYLFESGGDVPFAIVFDVNDVFLATESTEESHTISITEVVHDMKQLDEKYLPILEEKNKEIFSIHNISTGEYETDIVLSEGTYNVTVDDTVMKADFINDGGDIVNQNDLCFIASFDGGIFFGFQDGGTHSVKIEIPVNVVKEEYLPESVTATPNWNAVEGENGYIENRTHYEGRVLISTFDSSTDKMTPARYYEDTDYFVVVDGVEYITRVQHKHHSTIGLYHSYLGTDAGDIYSVDADPPFSLYTYSSSGYPDLDAEEVELSFNYAGFEDGHTCEVYQYELKQLDEKFLPVTEDDEILEMLMEQDMLLAVTDSDGSILSDENDNILLW